MHTIPHLSRMFQYLTASFVDTTECRPAGSTGRQIHLTVAERDMWLLPNNK